MKIITGAFSYETSTFTPVATTWQSYRERFGYLRGEEILTTFRDTNTPIGGFIEGADAHGFELIATVFAEPQAVELCRKAGVGATLELEVGANPPRCRGCPAGCTPRGNRSPEESPP